MEEAKIKKILLEIRAKEIALAKEENLLVNPTDMEHAFGLAVAAINTAAESFVIRMTPKVIGLRDEYEAAEILRDEVRLLFMAVQQFNVEESFEAHE